MPKNYRVQKKCDYAFYYHEDTQQVSDLYDALTCAGAGDVEPNDRLTYEAAATVFWA